MIPFFAIDQWAYQVAQAMSSSWWWLCLNRFWSFLGDGWFLYPLAGIASLFLFFKKRWKEGIWALAALGLSIALNSLAKIFFERPRPVSLYPGLLWDTYAFPSGHAFGSLFAYGMAFWIFRKTGWGKRWEGVVFAGFVLIVGLIGFSRIALGAHWLTDVLAGYVMGLVWIGINVWFCRKWRLFQPPLSPPPIAL